MLVSNLLSKSLKSVTFPTLLSFILFIGCSPKEVRHFDGMVWNTMYHITYESDTDLSDSILYIFDEIDSSLSPFNQNSVVSAVNTNTSLDVDRHFQRVYEASRRINEESGGAFDPTLAPIIRAWGFGQGHEVSADTLYIDSLLNLVGIDKTELKGLKLTKSVPAIEFNFSAIAKGYGVDCVAEMLTRNRVDNFLVEVGGEIRASGLNPQGNSWTIGIDKPSAEASVGESIEKIRIGNEAVATSGNYRNYHENNGKQFGHTISPQTGRPIATDVISATVIAPSCMQADALATSCMVLGSVEGLQLCNRLNVAVMMIKPDMSIVTNQAFSSYLK